MLVFPPHEMVHKLDEHSVEGHGWLAAVWSFEAVRLVIIAVYMKSGEGMQGPTNAGTWANLIAFTRNLEQPFVVIGDFNEDPGELHKTHIIKKTGGKMSLTGSELDWSFVSHALVPIKRIPTDWTVPCKPHCLVKVDIELDRIRIPVPQLKRYPPIPKLQNWQWGWRDFAGSPEEVVVFDQEITVPDQQFAKWASQAESYALPNVANAEKGRGRLLQIEVKELHDTSKTWMWKRGSQAFWGQLLALIQHGQIESRLHPKLVRKVENYLIVMSKHWQMEHGLEEMQDHLAQLLNHWTEDECNRVQEMPKQQEELARTQVMKEETEQYREWLTQGFHRGYKQLFRAIKRDEEPHQRPFQNISFEQRMEKRFEQWDEMWQVMSETLNISNEAEIIQRGIQEAKTWPPLNPEYAMSVIRRLEGWGKRQQALWDQQ